MTYLQRWRLLALVASAVALLAGGWMGWRWVQDRYFVTAPDAKPNGPAVTQLVTARLGGMRQLRVAELAGIVQATASDVRGLGWLRSDQVVKMPYTIDYLVDLSQLGPRDLEWNPATRTLIVDAPDLIVGRVNTEEGRRTLVRTSGIFVTRAAAETLSLRIAQNADAKVGAEARSPERMAQARELARRGLAATMSGPLAALGYGDARVVVTFPADRSDRLPEQVQQSTSLKDAYEGRAR